MSKPDLVLPAGKPARAGRTVSFRSTLLAVILGLIFASSLSTTWFNAGVLQSVILTLLNRQIETTLDAVTGRVEALFEPSDRLLLTFAKRIQTGSLPISDPIETARGFSEALLFEAGIKWIGFGYADGRFAGASLDGEELVFNVSAPDGSAQQEWKPDSSGKLVPFYRNPAPGPFDARERIWFQMAKDQKGIVWTPPYEFTDQEGRGISVTQSVRAQDGTLIGVLTVDFLLKDVTDYLDHLKKEFQGDTLVFSIRGHILASPKSLDSDPMIDRIRERLEGQESYEKIQREGGRLVMNLSVLGEKYFAGVRSAVVPGNLDCISAIIFSRKQAFGAIEKTIFHGVLTALVALGASLTVGFFLAGRIANPLKSLARDVARIARFDLSPHPMPRSDIREIRALSDSIELMRTGLQSFSHYVPVDLVRDLVHSGGVAELGGERRDISIMFCDLAGFTAYAENTSPEDALKILTAYFEDFGSAIDANAGEIDKFLGDGVMGIFNAPERIANPAAAACRAALQGIASMQARESRFTVRIGLHCGSCLVGNVGTAKRFTYTAIGDSVNLTSRLEGINKLYATQIIASSAFQEAAGDGEFLWRRLDRVAVAGRAAPLDIYELMAFRATAPAGALSAAGNYSAAFEAFLQRDFERASRLLAPLAATDEPSRLLLARIANELSGASEPDGGGVNRFLEK
ncbi:MAG: adenylate/guanylate cyclase domain-containing protein [Verrucomicrobiae bacterium]